MNKTQNAFIFARGGSKGIKDKNIKPLAGVPLIGHAIACALGSKYISRVTVSTDSEKIADVARAHGAEVIMRPDALATDKAPEIEAWRHALRTLQDAGTLGQGDLFISLPATSPLRICEDVDAAIERYQASGADILFGISPSDRNPYLNMVKTTGDFIEVVNPGHAGQRRQDVPDVYDVTTCVYVARPDYVLGCERLMDGNVGYSVIPKERALDIDTPYDFHLAEVLMANPFKG